MSEQVGRISEAWSDESRAAAAEVRRLRAGHRVQLHPKEVEKLRGSGITPPSAGRVAYREGEHGIYVHWDGEHRASGAYSPHQLLTPKGKRVA